MTRHISMIVLLGLSLAFTSILPAVADDATDAQAVISSQLQAFKTGSSADAYSYAAPNIKAMFPSSDIFMDMVRSGYKVVADANNVTFGAISVENGVLRQDVNMTDSSGQSFIASYTLVRQPDGSLKITSCSIRKGDDVSA